MTAWAEEETDTAPSEPWVYHDHGRRDPFKPLVVGGRIVATIQRSTSEDFRLVLNGILWDSAGESFAMVNDLEVRVGDIVEGYEVKAIFEDAVMLDNGGEQIVLRIEFDEAPKASSGAATGGTQQ